MAGCVPLNLFGEGNTTAGRAQLHRARPPQQERSRTQALYLINQVGDVPRFRPRASLPLGVPGRREKIAVAFGFEDRLEQQRVQRDPLQLGATGGWESGNFAQYAGQYNVQEGFLELTVPVLKDDIVDSPWSSHAAGRITPPGLHQRAGGDLEAGRLEPGQ